MKDRRGAAPATYRNAVKKIAKLMGWDPNHTRRPKMDFIVALDDLLDSMDEKSRERALTLYKMGVRRGIDEATTAFAEGEFYIEGEELFCPDEFTVSVSIRFQGDDKLEKLTMIFRPKDIGFS